jgi:hypothetical protein
VEKMRKSIYFLLIASLLVTAPHASAASTTTCPTINKISVQKGITYICLISGKKKIWQILTLDLKIKLEVEKAVNLNIVPKVVIDNLLTARKDKSAWLDQICSVDFSSTDTPLCEAGELTSKKLIVLYGDSHAAMWMSSIDKIAKKYNYKVRLFSKLACPLVEKVIWSYQLNRPFDECSQWQQRVLSTITELSPAILITTDQWKPAVVDGKKSDFDTVFMWEKEFPIAISHLAKLTKSLIVIGNNPSLTQDPVDCVSKPKVTLPLCSAGRTQADNAKFNSIEAKATKAAGGIYVDTVAWSCNDSLCPVIINEKLAYFDQWHFSETYIQYLTPALEFKLKSALK